MGGMGAGRAHRLAGLIVLVGALVLAFLVARGASFPVAGAPMVDWPQPPAVGTCQELNGSDLQTVPCEQPHGMEVTEAWQATDTLPQDLAGTCDQAADAYLGPAADPPAADGWVPDAPHYSAYQWSAPPADVVGGRGWMVCLIAPWRSGEYTGTVRDLASIGDRPASYGMCGLSDDSTLVPCDQPHSWEQFGLATQQLPTVDDERAMAQAVYDHMASCRKLAASLIGVADPTYGDRLQVVVEVQRGFSILIGPGGTSGPITYGSGSTGGPPSGPVSSVAPGTGASVTGSPAGTGTPTTATAAPSSTASAVPSSTASTAAAPSTAGSSPAPAPAGPTTASPARPTRSSPLASGTAAATSDGNGPSDGTTSATTRPPAVPIPSAILTCQVLDPQGQLVGSLMGWGNRPLPIK